MLVKRSNNRLSAELSAAGRGSTASALMTNDGRQNARSLATGTSQAANESRLDEMMEDR